MEPNDNASPVSSERTAPQQAPQVPRRSFTSFVDSAVHALARHWLAMLVLFWGLYVGLPLLAPVFMNLGWTGPAKIIYAIYRPACHQRPDRSYFLGGPQVVYSTEELAEARVDVGPLSRDIGNEAVGWKVAFCERDVAIYGSLFLGSLAFALVRRTRRKWLMRFRTYLIFLVPLGIDGGLQLFGLYESNWLLRSLTGSLFGFASVFFAYPYLQDGFDEVLRSLTAKAGRD